MLVPALCLCPADVQRRVGPGIAMFDIDIEPLELSGAMTAGQLGGAGAD